GLDISERAHFIKAVDGGDFVVSDYFVGARTNNTPIITVALAQIGPYGGAAAVILGVLDLDWFGQIAKAFVEQSGSILMIDSTGTIIAQFPNRQTFVGQNFSTHP